MKKALIVLSLVLMVVSCGWEPMYAQRTSKSMWYFGGQFDRTIADEMTKIKISTIDGRFGQQIRNNLLDSLTPKGQPREPRYRLYVDVSEPEIWKQALQEDITATRERAKYTVIYRMVSGDEEVLQGNSVAFVSYDILRNPYSTTVAKKKAESDAARIIADDITLRLGAFFHTKFTGSQADGGI